MFAKFRENMGWVHTWFGLVFGFILMAVFFFGALSVFDREIDRWAIPETRYDPQPMPSFDKMLLPILQTLHADEAEYNSQMPLLHDSSKGPMTPRTELPAVEYWAYTTHRDPVLIMGVGFEVPHPKDPDGHNHIHGSTTIDPRNGNQFSDSQLKIGSDFFYPMHYDLHLDWQGIGWRLVGFVTLVMLAALVTGVLIHLNFFKDMFTFRAKKNLQRSSLDLHIVSGVVALPFLFFFSFTGILIWAQYHIPVYEYTLKPMNHAFEELKSTQTGLPLHPAGEYAPLASVDDMVIKAKQIWADRGMPGEVGSLSVAHLNDVNGYVSVYRAGSDRVALIGEGVHFKASTGEIMREDPPKTLLENSNEFLTGLHLQHFEHWFLRWLYVIGGLLGAICIATGFIFFVEKRKQKHAKSGVQASRIVDAMAVTTVTGMLIATVAILVANRLLPVEMANKGEWEKNVFWITWILTMLHAFWRSEAVLQAKINPAWCEQSWALVFLSITAVFLNWFTTGDHLIKTMFLEPYWAVAGVDLSLLFTALMAFFAAKLLTRAAQKQHPDMIRIGAHAS
jgi:uncharacterized iron-regulated membrane protein